MSGYVVNAPLPQELKAASPNGLVSGEALIATGHQMRFEAAPPQPLEARSEPAPAPTPQPFI